MDISTNAMHFWKSGFELAFGRNKRGKVFGIPSQLLLSKSNDVHSQNVFKQYITSYCWG